MIDMAAIVLPHPDSPTMPTVSPASTSNDRPSTARTVPLRSRMRVLRSSTSSRRLTGSALLQPDVERVLERVADEVERDDGDHDDGQRGIDLPPVAGLQVGDPVRQHRAPRGRGGGQAEAEVLE